MNNKLQLEKQLISYKYMLEDLNDSKKALDYFYREQDKFLKSVMWKFSIILIAKCFNSSKKGISRLNKNQYINKDFYNTLNDIISIRNEFIAHEWDSKLKVSQFFNDEVSQIDWQLTYSLLYPDEEEVKTYYTIINQIISDIRIKVEDIQLNLK